ITLPIISMSLRLILEVAAREYFDEIEDAEGAKKDTVYRDFLKIANEEMNKKNENYLSLTEGWLSSNNKFEARLAKYAHYNINYTIQDMLNDSCIVADILKFYFEK
ncbi:MAG: hypothetical protein L3J15_06240, partial [Devosiaceae bacterium]|nr:hypothetical protein [Devosiaceae bacterium]